MKKEALIHGQIYYSCPYDRHWLIEFDRLIGDTITTLSSTQGPELNKGSINWGHFSEAKSTIRLATWEEYNRFKALKPSIAPRILPIIEYLIFN